MNSEIVIEDRVMTSIESTEAYLEIVRQTVSDQCAVLDEVGNLLLRLLERNRVLQVLRRHARHECAVVADLFHVREDHTRSPHTDKEEMLDRARVD